jgi:hypothetical protein
VSLGPTAPKFTIFEEGSSNDDDSCPEKILVVIEVPLMVSNAGALAFYVEFFIYCFGV